MPPSVPAPTLDPIRRKRRRRRPPTLSLAAWRQFVSIAKPYWTGDRRWFAWSLLGLIIVLMLCETQLAVMLIDKAGEMTSALAGRERDRFWSAVQATLLVLAFAVPVYAFYYYMRDTFSNHWRRWLTGRFLDGYLHDRRYYALGAAGDIDNPDQRISEDINTFTGRSIHFLLIFLGSLMQLVAFSAVLWSISHVLVGFLALYAFVGTFGALYLFGAPLIRLNFWQLRREADFRFGLIRLRENAESIAFYRGESQERTQIDANFDLAFNNYARLIKKQRALNMFQRAFSQLTLVVPSVILADAVLSGEMEVGRAVQAAGAFAAVLGAVSLIVDNFESLSRFVAGIDRLHALAELVFKPSGDGARAEAGGAAVDPLRAVAEGPAIAAAAAAAGTIAGAQADATAAAGATATSSAEAPEDRAADRIALRTGDRLEIERLTLRTPQFGQLLLRDLDLSLRPGDGLLITGPSGCGKSSLLRAIAGLWRSGTGTIRQVPPEDVFFLPQQPYMQVGSLRSQLIYPSIRTDLDDARLLGILQEVRLDNLAERVGGLDAAHDWEKQLSVGEQQRLAFARVLVRRPRMVILDEATSALDGANEAALYQRLRDEGTTLVSIAHRAAVLRHHTHVLQLLGGGAWKLHDARDYRFES